VIIRTATADDVEVMRAIEVDAGERFRSIGLDVIADDDPPSPEQLRRHVADGTAWVAESDGRVAGYATASVVDGDGHLDQVSVLGSAAGRGVGRALVARVEQWTRDAGLPAVTLTTFRDVAWNGPYYERLGFTTLAEDDLGPELAAIRRFEIEAGLDVMPRVAMIRAVAPASEQ
jgi:GNAT superfamily N-acetyltransferase